MLSIPARVAQLVVLFCFCSQSFSQEKSPKAEWITLADRWEPALFGGEGEVTVKDGVIEMLYGDPITGVVWTGEFDPIDVKKPLDRSDVPPEQSKVTEESSPKTPLLPRDNYEVRWECCRDDGYDFVCAFTFPIGEQSASLVMGGWGGGTTGLSSIDGADASSNATTKFIAFENERWYKARVRVDAKKITVWIDEKKLFDHPRAGHTFDIRSEMDPCKPLGIANFQCDSRVRNVQVRRLPSPVGTK